MLRDLKKAFEQDIGAFQMECVGAECTEVEAAMHCFIFYREEGSRHGNTLRKDLTDLVFSVAEIQW